MDTINPYAVFATCVIILLAWAVASLGFAMLFGRIVRARDTQRPRYRRTGR